MLYAILKNEKTLRLRGYGPVHSNRLGSDLCLGVMIEHAPPTARCQVAPEIRRMYQPPEPVRQRRRVPFGEDQTCLADHVRDRAAV